jgi:hypothetical protein
MEKTSMIGDQESIKLAPAEEKALAGSRALAFIASNKRKVSVGSFDFEKDFTDIRGNYDYVPDKELKIGYYALRDMKFLKRGNPGKELEFVVASAADLGLRKYSGKFSRICEEAAKQYGCGRFDNIDEIISGRLAFRSQEYGNAVYVAFPYSFEEKSPRLFRFVRSGGYSHLWIISGNAKSDDGEEKELSAEDKIIFKIAGSVLEYVKKPQLPEENAAEPETKPEAESGAAENPPASV